MTSSHVAQDTAKVRATLTNNDSCMDAQDDYDDDDNNRTGMADHTRFRTQMSYDRPQSPAATLSLIATNSPPRKAPATEVIVHHGAEATNSIQEV